MPNEGWSGDLNAAKEFHASIHRPRDDDRRGRGSARGGRVNSSISRGGRGGSVFANSPSFASNNSKGRRDGLLTELPSHFWNPNNTTSIQNTQDANTEDCGDPMNIDDRGMASSQWAADDQTATDPAATTQPGTGSVPTPMSWDVVNSPQPGVSSHTFSDSVRVSASETSRPINSIRDLVVSPSQSQGIYSQAAIIDGTKGARDNFASEPQPGTGQQVTWGPRNTPVSSIKPFHSIIRGPLADQQLKDVQHGTIAAQANQGLAPGEPATTQAGHQWTGLKASRHAGTSSTQGPAIPAPHPQGGGLRRDLLQENGMLRGVQFTEDQGPQQDDDWLKTYNLNKVKDKCTLIAKQAFAAGDHDAEKALRKVATACNEVIRAKNELRDKKLEVEADKVLSKSQNAAWVHWIKFYRPETPASAASSSTRALSDNSNVQMQDAPAVVSSQSVHVQTPRVSIGKKQEPHASQAASLPLASAQAPAVAQFASFEAPEFDSIDSTRSQEQFVRSTGGFDQGCFGGFGSSGSQKLHQSATQQAGATTRPPPRDVDSSGKKYVDGVGTSSPQQPQPVRHAQDDQQSTKLTGLPSMFPHGLPPGFDDPQARQIFEDFFFQNKRLPRK